MAYASNRRRPDRLSFSLGAEPSPWQWLTRSAFAAVLVIAIARLMLSEILRDPWDVVPGGAPVPRAAGPGTAVVLDLLSGVPVLLIFARAALDRSFPLRLRWSDPLMLAVGLWTAASAIWATDTFLAAVSAANVLAAMALLWSASQTVRTWTRLRLVAAVGFGLMLVLVAQSVLYRAIDVQENVRYWQQNRQQILKERNWQEGSFVVRQFEQKLMGGDLSAFFNSPNTFAAVGVMLLFVSLGIPLQKRADGDNPAWAWVAVAAAASAAWIILEARSKTAGVTPVLGAGLLLIVWWRRTAIRKYPWRAYWIGVGGIALAMLALVGHGLFHHGLFPGHFSSSLDFRWKYWIASARMFAAHPLLGVGWANFGRSYLAVRLPQASEEIKDPHNFLVRCFTELGLVGGLLVVGWMLRLGWELVRGAAVDLDQPTPQSVPSRWATIGTAAAIVVTGVALNVVATIDFSQPVADVTLELMRRLLYLLVLLIGTLGGAMRSPHRPELDDRPAPWIYNGILTGILLLLVHNLIDFSLFETGVTCLAFMLIGSALGVRGGGATWRPLWAAVVGGVLTLGWLGVAVGFVAPIVIAEQHAADADELIRTAPTDNPAGLSAHWASAASALAAAQAAVPYNSDYVFRLARADLAAGDVATADNLLVDAQQMDPLWIDPYLLQANMDLGPPPRDAATIAKNFDRIVRLNPNDVSLHAQQGAALERLGQTHAAAAAFRAALQANDALPIGEPKRLSPEDRAALQSRAARDENQP